MQSSVIQWQSTDTPRLYAVVSFWKIRYKQNLRKWELSIYVCVCVWLNICICNGVHLQLSLQHTGILSVCVIFQHDYSATFLWMQFHSRNEKFGECFKYVIFI
jgi:hypothetical protein